MDDAVVPEANFFPLATDAWIADTHHLTRAERGLYIDLLILMWRSPRGRVPRDVKWLCSHLQIRADELSMLQRIVKEFCLAVGHKRQMLTQRRLQKERNYVLRVKNARRNGAKLAWTRRLSGSKTTKSYDVELMHPHPHPDGLERKKEREASSDAGAETINGCNAATAQLDCLKWTGLGLNGKKNPHTKPHHGQQSKNGRIWLDKGTPEFAAYAADFRDHHHGQEPAENWNNSGAWFNTSGELAEQYRRGK